mgnify:CR=1 FL=1
MPVSSNQEILDQIIRIAKKNSYKDQSNYLLSYQYFIEYFKNNEIITLENIVIGISFTYSWMPTILKTIELKNAEDILRILNNVKKGILIKETELWILKKTFNNSLVGTSKLLHFINPEQYAIWDSRVFQFLYHEKPYKYKLEQPALYLEYLQLIQNLIDETNFDIFFQLMTKSIGYQISPFRALELAFFIGE